MKYLQIKKHVSVEELESSPPTQHSLEKETDDVESDLIITLTCRNKKDLQSTQSLLLFCQCSHPEQSWLLPNKAQVNKTKRDTADKTV